MEQKLLAALCRRVHYETLSPHIVPSEHLSPAGALIFAEIAAYFRADPAAQTCDLDILADRVCRKIDSENHRNMLRNLISDLPRDVSGINVIAEWGIQRSETSKSKLLQVLATPTAPITQIQASLADYQACLGMAGLESSEKPYDIHDVVSVETLRDKTAQRGRLPILPTALNGKIGAGALPQSTLLFFARPEVGKTAFAVNLARGVARQGKAVLYLGNEEPIVEMVMPRAWCCFSGLAWDKAGPEMESLGRKNGIENVTFVSLWPGTPAQVGELVDKYKPDLTIVEQVGNLTTKNDNRTQQLGSVMQDMRAIAKRSGTVMACFHQAGDSAQDKLVLELGDLSWSNTDMAAQADLMVGIGCNPTYLAQGLRMLSVCKNKLSGWHGHFPVEIDTKTSRYKSVGET